MAMLRNQAPHLQREELDVELLSTFAMWNAHGLNVFDRRLPEEPTDRARYSMSEAIGNPQPPMASSWLVEDIQLGLCGMFSSIWRHAQLRRSGTAPDAASQESLSHQLGAWKRHLDRISGLCNTQNCHAQTTASHTLKAYLGDEDQSVSGWEASALARITSLVLDATMLYHLLGIHLHADVSTINLLAMDLGMSNQTWTPPPRWNEEKVARTRAWALSNEAREAVSHAIAVLNAYEMATGQSGAREGCLEPVASMALSTSAAVVWAWTTNTEGCSCVPGLTSTTGLEPAGRSAESDVEKWINGGGSIVLDGVAFCKCTSDVWVRRFEDAQLQGGLVWEDG